MPPQKYITLIYPPVSVASEAPAGVARLVGYLRSRGVASDLIDLNIEGLMAVAGREIEAGTLAGDTWTRRASASFDKNLAAIRSPELYKSPDRYKRAVLDVNRLLHTAGRAQGVTLSLCNYSEAGRLPVRSQDLADAARDFENNLFFPFFEKRLSLHFSKKLPQIAGISVNFMSQALCASAIAGFIRARFPSIRIVFGGGLVGSWLNIPGFKNPLPGIVDDLVKGPGESALAAMSGQAGNGDAFTPGFPYDFSDFNLESYLSPGFVLPLSASDGCYWRKCSFCPESAEKKTFRHYRFEKVGCGQGEGHGKTPRPALIHFLDNALSPRFMQYLIDNPPGAPWYGFTRITNHLADPGFAAGLAASGCVMLKLGIESGDQAVLDGMGKGTRIELVSRVLKTLKSSCISVYGYLLFGTPGEDERSAGKTTDFIMRHIDTIDFLNLAIFNLPAYCQAAATLKTRSFYQGDLSLYREFIHPQGWHRDRIRRFLEKEFKSLEPIRKIINHDPPFFTSHHAPFFSRLYSRFNQAR